MKKKVTSLITGGAGFIGSHVVDSLINLNQRVVVIDDLSGGFIDNINSQAKFIKGSIMNIRLLEKLFFKYHFDYVYHLAAYAAEGLSHFIRHFNYENNLLGSINLINQSIKYKIKHFIFTSSIAVYGPGQTPMSEIMTPQPEDPYGIAKYATELDLKSASKMFGLTYTIFRPHNVYGERQNLGDPYRNVIGIFMNQIMNNLPMTIFGNGQQTRAFSYITDVAPYIANCVNKKMAKNQIINIGADQPYSVLKLAKVVAQVMGIKPKINFLPQRNEVVHAFSNHQKARKIFNIKTFTSLEKGIKKMTLWAEKSGPRKSQGFKGKIDIYKNMPPSWQKLIK